MPSVTFLMAARNAASTIGSAVTSALGQDYEGEVRVVVIDDASTDGTSDQIPSMEAVHIIRNESRLGRSGSRNRGLGVIETDLVAIHDADDISLPHRLSSTVPLALEGQTVVGSQLILRDERRGVYPGPRWPTTARSADLALADFRTPVPHPAMLLPADMMREVGGYNMNFPVAEDLELMLRLRAKNPNVKFVNSDSQTVLYTRSELDSASYAFRSSYWRYRAEVEYRSTPPLPVLWLLDASERYARQRLRYARRIIMPAVTRSTR